MIHFIHTNSSDTENTVVDLTKIELNLERDLLECAEGNAKIFPEGIFGEQLLLLSNQKGTRGGKRSDIIALDRAGNAVVIELKRDAGRLGIETQALTYLADISAYKGSLFLQHFHSQADNIRSFLGANFAEQELNQKPRIMLLARSFDQAVYSVGEWLASAGVPFRCSQFRRIRIGHDELLTFATAFDRSRDPVYPLAFVRRDRAPAVFWHIIGNDDLTTEAQQNDWWHYLVNNGIITASFDNAAGDPGEQILRSYIPGDRILAYAVGKGAVGWGTIKQPKYHLISPEPGQDPFGYPHQLHRHRLSGVAWNARATDLADAIPASDFRNTVLITHCARRCRPSPNQHRYSSST